MEAGNATSTAGASPLPAEIAEAMRGLTAAEVARAHDLLERAEAAQDPRVARLVVAIATEQRRHPVLMAGPWLCTLGVIVACVVRLLTGHRNGGTWVLLVAGVVIVPFVVAEVREFVRLPRAIENN